MKVDPWLSMMSNLVQDYEGLRQLMEQDSEIRLTLNTVNRKHIIHLTEKYMTADDAGNTFSTFSTYQFDEVVEWINSELDKWEGVKRTAFDRWEFKNKQVAEKFITYYNIACPK